MIASSVRDTTRLHDDNTENDSTSWNFFYHLDEILDASICRVFNFDFSNAGVTAIGFVIVMSCGFQRRKPMTLSDF